LDFARKDGSPGDQAADAAKPGEKETRVKSSKTESAGPGMARCLPVGSSACKVGGSPGPRPKAKAPRLKIRSDPRTRKVKR